VSFDRIADGIKHQEPAGDDEQKRPEMKEEKCHALRTKQYAKLQGVQEELLKLVSGRRGHFLYESGHHGEVWFDLETLCRKPAELRQHIAELAAKLAAYKPEIICGPLVEGAFIALMVANEIKCEFVYASRIADGAPNTLFPISYRLPVTLRPLVKGKRVAIVNDVTNAGSAVRGALHNLRASGADVVAIGSLVLMGNGFVDFAREQRLALESLFQMPNNLWLPKDCPHCTAGMPLEKLANA
jgi:orotate phosphoribosyltransferase